MSEHTPGPWSYNGGIIHAVYGGDNQAMIANLTHHATRLEDRKVADANCRLIASAPDLLAACKELLAEHRIFPKDGCWWCPFCGNKSFCVSHFQHTADCPVEAARAVIAKAEGDQ